MLLNLLVSMITFVAVKLCMHFFVETPHEERQTILIIVNTKGTASKIVALIAFKDEALIEKRRAF